jgi:hypothetical protein
MQCAGPETSRKRALRPLVRDGSAKENNHVFSHAHSAKNITACLAKKRNSQASVETC